MSRTPLRLLVVLAALVALAGRARAAVNYGTMSMQLGQVDSSGTFTAMNATQQLEFFASASCLCDRPFTVQMTLVGAPAGDLGSQPVEIWVGSSCNDTSNLAQRNARCYKVDNRQIETFHNRLVNVTIDSARLMFPNSSCGAVTGTNTVWALVDQGADGTYDNVWQLAPAINYDTEPPPSPSGAKAVGIEDGVRVSWTAATSVSGVRGYQVLCASAMDGQPVFLDGKAPASAEYRRTSDIAGCVASAPAPDAGVAQPDGGVLGPPDAGLLPPVPADASVAPDASVAAAPTVYDDLDPRFICSGLVGPTSDGVSLDFSDTSRIRAGSLELGVVSKIVVIDLARNYNTADVGASGPPVPVRDAWEYYHDQGGSADGGYCFVATAAYGDYDHPYVKVLRRFRDETLAASAAGRGFIAWYYAHSRPWAAFLRAHPVARATAAALLFPVVGLAALWNALGPFGLVLLLGLVVLARRWRRRGRRLATAALVLGLVGAASGVARAQVWIDDEDNDANARRGPPISDWAADIRLGPYYPDVDGESGVTGKPFATLFGSGNALLAQVGVEHFFFHPGGELGLGVSAGYLSMTAKSFIEDPVTHHAKCTDNTSACRSADDTQLRVFPLALVAVYRLTALADRTYVPLVPYVKAGLAYDIWRITKGNGDLAHVTGADDAAGGTLGVVATAGLAFRIDRLDADAARAMESELGIEHMTVFGELTYADVSGLGMANRLHLGDLTWSAGLGFEF
jgi:hypothetical protein